MRLSKRTKKNKVVVARPQRTSRLRKRKLSHRIRNESTTTAILSPSLSSSESTTSTASNKTNDIITSPFPRCHCSQEEEDSSTTTTATTTTTVDNNAPVVLFITANDKENNTNNSNDTTQILIGGHDITYYKSTRWQGKSIQLEEAEAVGMLLDLQNIVLNYPRIA